MKGQIRSHASFEFVFARGFPSCAGIVALAVALALPASADRRDRRDRDHHRGECHEVIRHFNFDDPNDTGLGRVSLDEIVPEAIQHLIVKDRDSLTGVWVSELELFTNVNAEACKVPQASDCPVEATESDPDPRQPLTGACPEDVSSNMYRCGAPLVWTNNTVANYELSTGSIYSLNVWRIWFLFEEQEDGTMLLKYPTPESVIESGDAPGASGYVYMNGVRNLDDTVLQVSSVGEVVLTGASTGGHPALADRIILSGAVHDSNVGRVILSNTLTDTGISLIYAPGDPREAVWKINLRKEPNCVSSEAFSDLTFPSSTRKIRIKRDRD